MYLLRSFFLYLLASIAALIATEYVVKSFCILDAVATSCPASPTFPLKALLFAGILFSLVNMIIKPILKIVALPFILVTMGLFVFVINAGVLYLVVWLIQTMQVPGVVALVTGGFLTYVEGGFVLGLCNLFAHWLTKR